MKEKQIFFKKTSQIDNIIKVYPEPAIKHIPKWFRDTKMFTNGENDYVKAAKDPKEFFGTNKGCIPFLDTFSSGYMVLLPATVLITNTPQGVRMAWKTDFAVADTQPQETLGNFPIPVGHNKTFFRWQMHSRVITPKGYSIMVTHPNQRYDLPFQTLTGIIDTDKHKNPLHLPFFLEDGFEGFIEEGTPIAQILPFKRDVWKSNNLEYTEDEVHITDRAKFTFWKTYKKKYWTRKSYQ